MYLILIASLLYSHLEGASGALGIIKAIFRLHHDEILPNASFDRFNCET